MASAYVGILTLPPRFGVIAYHFSAKLLPAYLLLILAAMIFMFERLSRIHPEQN